MMSKHFIHQLIFETTPQCCLNCRHCYNIQKITNAYSQKILNTNDTIFLLKKTLQQIKCTDLILTGGEFYTRPDTNEIILAAEQSGVKSIHIMTNGACLDAEKIAFAKAHQVRLFEISFISADKKIFDTETQAQNFSAFDNAVFATQEIVKQKILVSHIFVATKKNIHTLLNTLNLSYALGVRNFSFNRFNPCGNGKKYLEELQLSPLELMKGLEICEKFAIEHPDMAFHSPINIPPCIIDTKKYKHISFTLCGVGFHQSIIVLDYLGNVRLCPFSPTIVGNIKDMTLSQMFKTEAAKNFIQAHPKFCDKCKLVKKCQGGCKASSDNCFGNPWLENPFLAKYKTKPIT
ncbi:MAG: radical SAM protein [Alphaproteobacteria bacterium]|nr:radical SAM protein [Alphaproteobacteria bacterium]